MKLPRASLITIFTFFTVGTAYSLTYYRHIPFSLSMSAADTLIVNYDFREKSGIICSATRENVRIDFFYKGHKKFDHLPVTLISQVPEKNNEQLADAENQFTLHMDNMESDQEFTINCNFI